VLPRRRYSRRAAIVLSLYNRESAANVEDRGSSERRSFIVTHQLRRHLIPFRYAPSSRRGSFKNPLNALVRARRRWNLFTARSTATSLLTEAYSRSFNECLRDLFFSFDCPRYPCGTCKLRRELPATLISPASVLAVDPHISMFIAFRELNIVARIQYCSALYYCNYRGTSCITTTLANRGLRKIPRGAGSGFTSIYNRIHDSKYTPYAYLCTRRAISKITEKERKTHTRCSPHNAVIKTIIRILPQSFMLNES